MPLDRFHILRVAAQDGGDRHLKVIRVEVLVLSLVDVDRLIARASSQELASELMATLTPLYALYFRLVVLQLLDATEVEVS